MDNNEKNSDKRNNQDTGELSFLQAKIKPQHRRKLKKILGTTALTLFLAVLFGFVARLTFSVADKPVEKLLGIDNKQETVNQSEPVNKRDEVKLPSSSRTTPTPETLKPVPTESGNAQDGETGETESVTGAPTEAPKDPSDSENNNPGNEENINTTDAPVDGQGESGNAPETENVDNTGDTGELPEVTLPVGDEEPETEPEDTEDEETPLSPLQNYLAMMEELRVLADKASAALLKVTAITGGINWLDENIESSEYTTGVVMGDNSVELLILTEYGKLAMADRIEVAMPDGNTVPAELYAFDADYNLAVVAVELDILDESDKRDIAVATLAASDKMIPGEPIVALGSPNGYNSSMEFGFVTGIGSKGYITDNEIKLFTTDLSWHEDGEGVVINMQGEIIGLLTHSLGDSAAYSITSAVEIGCLTNVMIDLLNGLPRTYFGIKAEDIPASVRQDMGIAQGIYVNEVLAGSPAFAAGVKKGDVIMNLGDAVITDVAAFGEALSGFGTESAVKVRIYRSSSREEPIMELSVIPGVK